jgi:DNA-binding response OmpR family regulator
VLQPESPSIAANARHRLLMIDDDIKLCHLIRDYFNPMGFELYFAHDGHEGLKTARNSRFDAILLDVMLPGLDGFELLRQLRMFCTTPVVMLTGRGEETDRIVGLEIGADDYVPKTTSTRELLARIRAVLRRATPPPPPSPTNQVQALAAAVGTTNS